MADENSNRNRYPVEISGWKPDDEFFVERTDLIWPSQGDKTFFSRHDLPKGTVIFLRLKVLDSETCGVPVTYQVTNMRPYEHRDLNEIHITPLQPRSKAPFDTAVASNLQEDTNSTCELRESSTQVKIEEILQ